MQALRRTAPALGSVGAVARSVSCCRGMLRRIAFLALALAACTATPVAVPSPSPSPALNPSPRPSSLAPGPDPVFSAARALRTIRALAGPGPREAASAAYRDAAQLVADRFRALGYDVRLQRFDVLGGTVDGTPVEAGSSLNVIAEPAGFDPRAPHVVVGGHLDSVPDSPGANDNASGVAAVLELARMAARSPRQIPVVFVAFGAEERRRQSPTATQPALGSETYVGRQPRARADALWGMLNLDMVGDGSPVEIIGTDDRMTRMAARAARRLDLPFLRRPSVPNRYSDHVSFADAGVPAAFLHTGDQADWHEPTDVAAVINLADLRRVGRLAWEILSSIRPRG